MRVKLFQTFRKPEQLLMFCLSYIPSKEIWNKMVLFEKAVPAFLYRNMGPGTAQGQKHRITTQDG